MEEIQQWGPLDPSIHKALASLDRRVNIVGKGRKLRSTRLSRASTGYVVMGIELVTLRSTRLSRASTSFTAQSTGNCHFDPQGSREPRRSRNSSAGLCFRLRSTRLSRASTSDVYNAIHVIQTSIHKALASLDLEHIHQYLIMKTSIHKALASLDGKNAQLFLHLCHIYMLHIIHLLQIVYQVEISSRNLIVFSGQL